MSRASTLFHFNAPHSPEGDITSSKVPKMDIPSLDMSASSRQEHSLGEYGRLDHLAHKMYRRCQSAGDNYAEVAVEVHKLHSVLRILRERKEYLESRAFRRDPQSADELIAINFRVRHVLEELDIVMEKFENQEDDADTNLMSAAKKKIWMRLRYGSKKEELAVIKFKIINYTSTISTLFETHKVSPTSRSRPESVARRPERRNSESDRVPLNTTSSTSRSSGTTSPTSTSQHGPVPIPARLLSEVRANSDRGHRDAGAMHSEDRSSSAPPSSLKNSKGTQASHKEHKEHKEHREHKDHREHREHKEHRDYRDHKEQELEGHPENHGGRRRRSSSLLNNATQPKPDVADVSSSSSIDVRSAVHKKPSAKLSKSCLSAVITAANLKSTNEVPTKVGSTKHSSSKPSSPTESKDADSGPEGKMNASKSASEPSSATIAALNLDDSRRHSVPVRTSARAASKREAAMRGHRHSVQVLDDVRELSEKSNPPSRLSTVTTPESTSPPAAAEVKDVKESKAPKESKETKEKAAPARPTVIKRTMSSRPFTDPFQKAAAIKAASKAEPKATSPKADSRFDKSSTSNKAESIKSFNFTKSNTKLNMKTARRKRQLKYSWYKTLNNVKSLRDLRSQLGPNYHGGKLKSCLKDPSKLKKDPGDAGKDLPANAQFTKVSRRVITPEALELGHEKFEIKDRHVIVLRVLSRQEIEGYANRTRDIREQRKAHHGGEVAGDSENEEVVSQQKMVGDVVSGLANIAAMFLQKKQYGIER